MKEFKNEGIIDRILFIGKDELGWNEKEFKWKNCGFIIFEKIDCWFY